MSDFVNKCPVFTYWEGAYHPFTQLCLSTISRHFGHRHIHLSPSTIPQFVGSKGNKAKRFHISLRSDYLRTVLLSLHGGWWFDCDVLLLKNPTPLLPPSGSMVWNLKYFEAGEWRKYLNIGTIYASPNDEWIHNVMKDFENVCVDDFTDLTLQNESVGQDIYQSHADLYKGVKIGHEHDFNSTVNVAADHLPYWDGTIDLSTVNYGLHLGASLARWSARAGSSSAISLLGCKSIEQLTVDFPRSPIAEYARLYPDWKKYSECI